MARQMSDEDLAVILRKAIDHSEHLTDGKLSRERLDVERYYRGELPTPMHKGDSKYVSRDVFDAVDSMRATVLEAFMAHTRIVFFRPERGETVADAKQATEYCRHVFFKENDGEQILYDVLTDGLMKRFSVVKVFHEVTTDHDDYEFENLTPDELTASVEEHENFEFTEAEVTDQGLYTGSFRVENRTERIVCEVVQPEDLLVASRTTSLADAKYVIHRTQMTRSDLLQAGLDKSKVDDLTFASGRDIDQDYQRQSRFEHLDDVIGSEGAYDQSVEEITVYECYIRLDMEKTGISQLWKITFAQGQVLDKEKISRIPFAAFVPLPIPHTFSGENFAASVIPVQNARTVLIRQIINHSLITNNPRLQVLNGTVQNPNELLENRLGGIVNVRRMDGLAPIPQAQLNPFVFNLIQMIDEDKEEVTGVSKLSQGMNKDAISTQNAEGMVEQLISQSQQRQKIIARRFGKFLKDLWLLIYDTAVDHVTEAEFSDATGDYVPVNPKFWNERSTASVELTLSYGELEKEAMRWAEIDQYFSQDPQLQTAYGYDKRYEVIRRSMEKRGIEDIETFLTPPEEYQPPEPGPAEQLQMEAMKAQIEMQKAQAQAMMAKAETDRLKAQADLIRAQADAQRKADQSQLEMAKREIDAHVALEELKLAQQVPDSGKRGIFSPRA
jgi:hypothetical protein